MSWSVYIGNTTPGGGLTPAEIKTQAAERFAQAKANFTDPKYSVELKTVEHVEQLVNENLDYLIANNVTTPFALESYGSITLPPADPSWNYQASTNFGVRFTSVVPAPEKKAEAAG